MRRMADMAYRRLGGSGLAVSVAGLGCNNFGMRIDLDATRAVVDAALDAGVTLFDTSDSYGASEEMLGEVLRDRRDDVVLATKFGSPVRGGNGADWGARGSRRYIYKAVERSLTRLRTDWIDLYQLHRPDPLTPIEETLSALTDLVHEGKVRYIGSSNFTAWQVADAEWIARDGGYERFISAQNNYNLIEREVEAELVPACEHFNVGLLPFFPLASGLLTGKYRRGEEPADNTRMKQWGMTAQLTDARFDAVDKLAAFASERSVSLLDVALGGLAAMPAVTSVIAGATTPEQLRANVAATAWQPDGSDLEALRAI
jgi:aryl-alcohol dehydrogenase-like predicted oxidoreductase